MKRFLLALIVCFVVGTIAVGFGEENYILAQLGDQGCDVELVLSKCAELGYIKNLPNGADEYTEEYEAGIRAMEKALGLEEDGIIRLNEFEELENAICIGSNNDIVREILERLYDLGYIQNSLPEKHSMYEEKLEIAIKDAEKQLGLKADGVLTNSEIKLIRKQQCKALPEAKNVKGTIKNGKVTITWSAVEGAVSYQIFRDSSLYATVSGTLSFTDDKVKMGHNYYYSVKPVSYYRPSLTSKSVKIEVEIVYAQTNLKEISNKGANNEQEYVKLESLNVESAYVSGKDYIINVSQKINGTTYYATLIMQGYKEWSGPDISKYSLKTIESCTGWISTFGKQPGITVNHISYSH